MEDLAHQAIQAAIQGDWLTAERLNRRIIQENPNDLEGMLRLANAVSQLGNIKEAIGIYEKILKIDPHNVFANRGILRIKTLKTRNSVVPTFNLHHTLSNSFLEEPGKTKTTILVHPAYTEILAGLDTGERLLLLPRRRRISVTTENGVYIGRLPDDLSMRLLGFIRGGNEYEAIVKSVIDDQVKIFIREVYRSEKFGLTPSFSPDITTNGNNE